jgi:hypothetical protein
MKDEPIEDRAQSTEKKALAVLLPGIVFRIYKRPNPNHAVCHVRAVVDDQYIVYRVWSARRRWLYQIRDAYYFGLLIENGNLMVIRNEIN